MASKIQKHYAIAKIGNKVEISPMKQWVWEHLGELDTKIERYEPTRTIRNKLKKIGWELISEDERVLMIRPDENGKFDYAKQFVADLEIPETQEELDEAEEALELTFSLEKDMQAAIRNDISQLESGMKIIDGGKEKSVYSGKIDILAEDKEGNIVVIELKAGYASPRAVTQVLAYMGDVKDEYKKNVRGILIADTFDKKVTSASKIIPDLQLKRYSFQFKYNEVV